MDCVSRTLHSKYTLVPLVAKRIVNMMAYWIFVCLFVVVVCLFVATTVAESTAATTDATTESSPSVVSSTPHGGAHVCCSSIDMKLSCMQ